MALYVIRHGETANDKMGHERPDGWSNAPITEEGQRQMHTTGNLLSRIAHISNIVSSDLPRAVQSAQIVAAHTGARVHTNPLLRPWHMGVAANRPMDFARPIMHFFRRERPEQPIPGGESYNVSKRRFHGIFHATVDLADRFPDLDIGMLTHSENVNMIPNFLSGGREPVAYTNLVPNGGVVKVHRDSTGRLQAEPLAISQGDQEENAK